MKIEHPAVFLFGAGATRGGLSDRSIRPPVDNDFFDIAQQIKGHGTPRLAKRVLKDVWNLYGRISGVGLETYYRDIETREKIGTFAKTKNAPKNWKRRKEDLNELIRRVIIQTTCETANAPLRPIESQLHRDLLQSVKDGDTLITFNYDTLIEESFENANIWSPVTGYGKNVYGQKLTWARNWLQNRGILQPVETKIMVLKLHGSINWELYRTKKVRIKPRPYVVRTRNGRIVKDKVSILPPGWNKQIDKNPYRELWHKARLVLEECKSLVIIGYSLPETDLLARALIAEVVRTRIARKQILKQLHIAEPNNYIIQKFVDLFAPTLGFKGHVFKYQDFAMMVAELRI
jgi:hypothetical protein